MAILSGVGEDASIGPTGIFGLRLLAQPRVQRAALWTILVVFALTRAVQFATWTTQIQWGYDFSAYWLGGRHVLEGSPIYAPFQLGGSYSPQQQYLYLYPPFLAVVIAPLAALFADYRVANWLWAGLGALVLAMAVATLGRRERLVAGRDIVLLVAAAFVFAPVVGELVLGNVHLLIVGLLAGAWLGISSGTDRGALAAGVLVAVATLIKVFPGLIIVWFLLTGRPRAAVAAVLAMVVLAAATLPIVGLGPWLDYPVVLLNLGAPVDATDVLAPTVWLSGSMPTIVARTLVTVVGLGVIVWTTRHRADVVSYAVTIAISILVAPALYQHYLAVLVVPLVLGLRHAPPVIWVVVAYLLLSGGKQEALGDAAWIVNRAIPTLGALLVVAGLCWFGRRADGSPALTTSYGGARVP
jgi:hypothetical protein